MCADFTSKFPELFCYAMENNLVVWNFISDQVLSKIEIDSNVNCLSFSDSGLKIVIGCENKMINMYFFEPEKNETMKDIKYPNYQNPLKVLSLNGHTGNIKIVLISANEEFILSTEDSDSTLFSQNILVWREKKEEEYIVM